jgi:hypothetical protein
MSHEYAEVVRKPLQVGERSDRTPDPRLALRFPRWAAACARLIGSYHRFVTDWSEVWGADLRLERLEVIDLGTRVVTLYNVPARAQASGVQLTGKWATVSTLKNGRVIRDQGLRE